MLRIGALSTGSPSERIPASTDLRFSIMATAASERVIGDDPEMLRDMLRLYDFRQSQETSVLIDAITKIECKRANARLKDGSIVNGVDIVLVFDDSTIDAGQVYLFGQVLSHFMGLYASINTFSRLTVRLSGITLPIARFEPRTADEVLL